MSERAGLVDKVREALVATSRNQRDRLFSEEALEAMRLAEEFKDIQPEAYILPLETMAGGTLRGRREPEQNA